MIDPTSYTKKVTQYFAYLTDEFGFVLTEEQLRGNVYYDVNYRLEGKLISISYENVEDYLLVIIFILDNGKLPSFDDETKTLHLEKLRAAIFPTLDQKELSHNGKMFVKFEAKTRFERDLLKSAKDLRLCLLHLK